MEKQTCFLSVGGKVKFRIIYTLVGVAGLYAISFYWLLNRD